MVSNIVVLQDYNKYLKHSGKADIKRQQNITLASIKCKHCGHSILPTKDRTLCTYCGHWIYKNDKVEFKYKTLEKIKNM